MADKVVMKVGKRYLGKKFGKTWGDQKKTSGDSYKYLDYDDLKHNGNPKLKPKDLEYFHKILEIPYDRKHPNKDALLARKIYRRAKLLDGKHIGPFRFGLTTIIGELIPVGGAGIDWMLAMTIVIAARNVSGGLDVLTSARMTTNATIDLIIGVIPVIGAIGDGFYKANTRNAEVFEQMLKRRVIKAKEEAEEEMMKAERAGRASSRTSAHTDQYLDSDPVPRMRQHVQTDGYNESEPAPQKHDHAQDDGYHVSEPAPALPPRGIDERHGGVHARLVKKVDSPVRVPKPSRSGGSWFSGHKNRKGVAVGQETNGTHGREMAQHEDLAPARPSRPDATRRQNVGHF